MLHTRRMLLLLAGVVATVFLIGPAWAAPISRDVVVMDYQSALGGTINIVHGGQAEDVYAGPYQFNVYQAMQSGGSIAADKDKLISSGVAMFCDSASYDLVSSYPYVQLSGTDVLNGYGRLYDDAPDKATAKTAYLNMSWALQYAFSPSQNTEEWYKAAQIYMWEKTSDAVSGDPFDLAHGNFQVATGDQTKTLLDDVNFINANANTSVMASLNVPVTLASGSGALYSDTISGATEYFKDSESSQEFLTLPTSPVPEPATLLLLGSGLVGLCGIARKHRKN